MASRSHENACAFIIAILCFLVGCGREDDGRKLEQVHQKADYSGWWRLSGSDSLRYIAWDGTGYDIIGPNREVYGYCWRLNDERIFKVPLEPIFKGEESMSNLVFSRNIPRGEGVKVVEGEVGEFFSKGVEEGKGIKFAYIKGDDVLMVFHEDYRDLYTRANVMGFEESAKVKE